MIKDKQSNTNYTSYTVKVQSCPYCEGKFDFSGYSKENVKVAIEALYVNINKHLSVCRYKKIETDKKLASISINTKKFSEKLYSSCFDTNQLLVG